MNKNIDPNIPKIAQISDKMQTALMWLFIAVGLLGVLYLLACMGSTFWINAQELVTAQDMKNSSWLSSPTTALHFGGFMGIALSAAALLVGAAMAIVKKTPFPFVYSIVLCSLMQSAFSSQLVHTAGIYSNTIKVGCYVWESKDCQDMLGLPTEKGSFSRYNKDNTAEFTPEYLTAFESLKDKPNQAVVALAIMPGGYFLMSPFTALHIEEVKTKLEKQRADLERYKNANKKEP